MLKPTDRIPALPPKAERETATVFPGRRARIATSIRYSQDLLNNLLRHPYTRVAFIQNDLAVTRQTAAKYLD